MENISPEVMTVLNSALQKLTGYSRRSYAAELCETFFNSSSRQMERHLKVGRAMVELGLNERRKGIRCLDNYGQRGAKKKKTSILI